MSEPVAFDTINRSHHGVTMRTEVMGPPLRWPPSLATAKNLVPAVVRSGSASPAASFVTPATLTPHGMVSSTTSCTFDQLDSNHDGVITRAEFERASGLQPSSARTINIVSEPIAFDAADRAHNVAIKRTEVVGTMLPRAISAPSTARNVVPAVVRSGSASPAVSYNTPATFPPHGMARFVASTVASTVASPTSSTFDQLDSNHDGVITRAEFERASGLQSSFPRTTETRLAEQRISPVQTGFQSPGVRPIKMISESEPMSFEELDTSQHAIITRTEFERSRFPRARSAPSMRYSASRSIRPDPAGFWPDQPGSASSTPRVTYAVQACATPSRVAPPVAYTFDQLDTDHDGVITRAEFDSAMSSLTSTQAVAPATCIAAPPRAVKYPSTASYVHASATPAAAYTTVVTAPVVKTDDGTRQQQLIRDQGMSFQLLSEFGKELEDLKIQSLGTSVRLDQYMVDNKDMESRIEKSLRQSIDQLQISIGSNMQLRQSQDDAMLGRLGDLEHSVSTSLPKFNREISEVRDFLEAPLKEIKKLRDQLRQHAEEWKTGNLTAIEHSTKLHDDVSKELLELKLVHESHMSDVKDGFAQQRSLIEQSLTFRSRLQELDDKFLALTRENSHNIEARRKDTESKQAEIQTSLEQLTAQLALERQAREALADELEQTVNNERTKLINMMTQKDASVHLECKEIHRTLTDLVTESTSNWQDSTAAIKRDHAGMYEYFGNRIDNAQAEFNELEQSCFSIQTSVRNFEVVLKKLETKLEPCLQGLRMEVRSSLERERMQRELADRSIIEHVNFLERFYKHAREFYMSGRPLPEMSGRTLPELPEDRIP